MHRRALSFARRARYRAVVYVLIASRRARATRGTGVGGARSMHEPDDNPRTFASSPCSMPELAGDPPANLDAWRREQRQWLLEQRLALTAKARAELAERMAERLDELLGDLRGVTVGVYWPIRGEPDLRPWMKRLTERGAVCALPVVLQRAAPLGFRRWEPGARMERGVWNIPIPADDTPVTPQVLVAPVVGFDLACYRLGYGGGFYDRTLAAWSPVRPRMVGVGYAGAQLATIHPQAHDAPMDCVVTESAVYRPDEQAGG